MSTSFGESLQAWRRSGGALAFFGVELVILTIFWERLSAILFALSYGGQAPDLGSFFRDAFLSGNYPLFVLAYVGVGAVFATIVFVVSAVSIPMLLDRNGDIYTAMATSFLAVTRNLPAMGSGRRDRPPHRDRVARCFSGSSVSCARARAWHAYREMTQWK